MAEEVVLMKGNQPSLMQLSAGAGRISVIHTQSEVLETLPN